MRIAAGIENKNMKSMIVAALALGVATASLVVFWQNKKKRAQEKEEQEKAFNGIPIRMSQHAMG